MTNDKVAVLIDAENVSHRYIEKIFQEFKDKKYDIKIKRAFADWTVPVLSSDGWKKVLSSYAITPTHLFNFSTGKNASDIQMVIYCMKLLYENPEIGTYILVSSDSDFTPLVLTLKESGKNVFGYGGEASSSSLVSACDEFTKINLREKSNGLVEAVVSKRGSKKNKSDVQELSLAQKSSFVRDASFEVWFDNFWLRDCLGWMKIDAFGEVLKEKLKKPWKFFGYRTLKALIKEIDDFEIKGEKQSNNEIIYYVRPKIKNGDKVLFCIMDSFKSFGKDLANDKMPIKDLEAAFVSRAPEVDYSLFGNLIDASHLYGIEDINNEMYVYRKMTEVEKRLNTLFTQYVRKSDKEWCLLGSHVKSEINDDLLGVYEEEPILKQLSFSQLVKKMCALSIKEERSENGIDYYFKI